MAAKKKVTNQPVVAQNDSAQPDPTEQPGDETVVQTAPLISIRAKKGTVLLRYTGESPVRAVANVPSKAQYKINGQGLVSVYAQDAEELISRGDFSQA